MCIDASGAATAAVNGACRPRAVLQPGIINLPAILLVGLMSTLLVIGIKESANFNNVIVFIKVAIVVLVIGFGFMYVNSANWHPFIPANTGEFGHFGFSGIIRGAAVVFFAYIGFDAVSTAAQEAKNPQKDMPIGILSSLAICTVLYILMALVMTGLTSYKNLNVPQPVYVAIAAAGPALKWLTYFINIGAILGLASVVLVMLMGQPRIFFSMSRDGLLPAVFGKVHPKFQTPYVTTIVTGVVAALVAGFFPIDLLGQLVSIGTLLAFVIVCFGDHGPALQAAQHPASVPYAARACRADPRHLDLRVHDVQPARRHLAPPRRLDGHRSCHLLPLQHEPLARRESADGSRRRLTAGGSRVSFGDGARVRAPFQFLGRAIGTTCRTRPMSI